MEWIVGAGAVIAAIWVLDKVRASFQKMGAGALLALGFIAGLLAAFWWVR